MTVNRNRELSDKTGLWRMKVCVRQTPKRSQKPTNQDKKEYGGYYYGEEKV